MRLYSLGMIEQESREEKWAIDKEKESFEEEKDSAVM